MIPSPDALRLQSGALRLQLDPSGNAIPGASPTPGGALREGGALSEGGVALLEHYAWRILDDEAVHLRRVEQPSDAELVLELELGAGLLRFERQLRLSSDALEDRLRISNPTAERRSITFEFELGGVAITDAAVAADALALSTGAKRLELRFDALAAVRPDGADWELSLAPGELVEVGFQLRLEAL